eukprot:TRINITY_DN13462_c0_g1_i2.p1 TRINITY_DN13462_c0_g1~~TRINITY_DN13462_c0_g1_i2.p1  ORF type:complete len:303 (+),score=43.37 TRINITY_DN13462_c0_g1_i2:40-948(+)
MARHVPFTNRRRAPPEWSAGIEGMVQSLLESPSVEEDVVAAFTTLGSMANLNLQPSQFVVHEALETLLSAPSHVASSQGFYALSSSLTQSLPRGVVCEEEVVDWWLFFLRLLGKLRDPREQVVKNSVLCLDILLTHNFSAFSSSVCQVLKTGGESLSANEEAISRSVMGTFGAAGDEASVPAVDAAQSSLKILFRLYKKTGTSTGHLTKWLAKKFVHLKSQKQLLFLETLCLDNGPDRVALLCSFILKVCDLTGKEVETWDHYVDLLRKPPVEPENKQIFLFLICELGQQLLIGVSLLLSLS